MDIEKLERFLQGIAIIVPSDDEEAWQVDYIDLENHAMYVTGEESGEQYYIDLTDFNPNDYMFYELKQTTFDSFVASLTE